eukprot:722524-Rhodomonas_salina.2
MKLTPSLFPHPDHKPWEPKMISRCLAKLGLMVELYARLSDPASGYENCDPKRANCSVNAACSNTGPDMFECTCNTGCEGDPTGPSSKGCIDIDKCSTDNGGCDQDYANSAGSFECSCETGYTLNQDGKGCDDITEREEGSNNCDANTVCENSGGSFTCTCNARYESDGATRTFSGLSCDDSVILGAYQSCTFPSNGCCDAAAGFTCYHNDKTHAQCLLTGSCSGPSWDFTEFEGFDAVCAEQPTATLAEHADCTSISAGCASCNAYGEPMACYQKDVYYSQCLVVGACPPSAWGGGSFSCAETQVQHGRHRRAARTRRRRLSKARAQGGHSAARH